MKAPLYTPEILRLAVQSAGYPRLAAPDASDSARTPVCGSHIDLDIALDDAGQVAAIGFDIAACAMGQASAAVLAKAIAGRSPDAIEAATRALEDWLAGTSDTPPDWPGIVQLAPARDRPGRHAAILLPFRSATKAAIAALTVRR